MRTKFSASTKPFCTKLNTSSQLSKFLERHKAREKKSHRHFGGGLQAEHMWPCPPVSRNLMKKSFNKVLKS